MTSFLNMLLLVFIISAVDLFAQNDLADLKMKTNSMMEKYSQAALNGEYNAMTNFFADDAISLPSYKPMLRGKDAILASFKKDFDSGMKYTGFKLVTTDVHGTGELKYEIGTYNISFTQPNMSEMQDHGKYLNIWQKESDGTLKIKVNSWNSDINPMSMNQAGTKSKTDENK